MPLDRLTSRHPNPATPRRCGRPAWICPRHPCVGSHPAYLHPRTHPSRSSASSLYAVTGGDNGGVFLWKGATCLRGAIVLPGGVCSLQAFGGYTVVCGGAQGAVKIVDVRTMAVLQAFSALPAAVDQLTAGAGVAGALAVGRPGSAPVPSRAQTARPSSASAGRATSVNVDAHSAALARKSRGAAGPKSSLTTAAKADQATVPNGAKVRVMLWGDSTGHPYRHI